MLHLMVSNVWPPVAVPRPLDLNINEILLNFSKLKNRPYQLVVKTTNLTLNFLENLLHYKNYLIL